MEKFDPIKGREFLLSEIGLRWSLSLDLGEALGRGVAASNARSFLSQGIESILLGLDQPAVWLLEKAQEWAAAGIEAREKYAIWETEGPNPLYHAELAMCNWLLHGIHDTNNLRSFFELEERTRLEDGWDDREVELGLPYYLEAGELVRACEIFETTPGLSRPTDLGAIAGEGSMAYVICLHRLGRAFAADDVQKAVRGFLARSVPDFLARGQFESVARWMKLIFWDGKESRDAAWQALLRCYEFLPGVSKPGGV
jgi:hypothetical protein